MLAVFGGLLLALQTHGADESGPFLWVGLIAVGLFMFFADMKNIYRSWRTGSVRTEILYTVEAWIAVFVGLFAIGYALPELVYPPGVMLEWLAATGILLILTRLGARHVLRVARGRGINTKRLAIAGTDALAHHVARTIAKHPWMGFRTVGLFDHLPTTQDESPRFGVGSESLTTIVDLARSGVIDTVFVSLPCPRSTDTLLEALSDTTASVYVLQDRRRGRLPWQSASEGEVNEALPVQLQRDALHRCWMEIGGIPAISVYETPFLGPNGWLKRLEDIVISSIALILLALPMAIIAIGVKRSSPGPVLFKQRRYGLAGEEIVVWKFRSMTVCEDGDNVTQARENDARVTGFGAFLRRTSLDELPQFINVLQGRMSIVGPRPHAVSHNEYYRKLVGGYMLRHKVKPGITGLAQINGWRGETDTLDKMSKRIEHDLAYIRRWSLWLDIRIIFGTVFNGFVHRNAY
ncbi:sugar transferase [Thiocapsa marina]|nr:sugar transferase [Thiocapsa marina]